MDRWAARALLLALAAVAWPSRARAWGPARPSAPPPPPPIDTAAGDRRPRRRPPETPPPKRRRPQRRPPPPPPPPPPAGGRRRRAPRDDAVANRNETAVVETRRARAGARVRGCPRRSGWEAASMRSDSTTATRAPSRPSSACSGSATGRSASISARTRRRRQAGTAIRTRSIGWRWICSASSGREPGTGPPTSAISCGCCAGWPPSWAWGSSATGEARCRARGSCSTSARASTFRSRPRANRRSCGCASPCAAAIGLYTPKTLRKHACRT